MSAIAVVGPGIYHKLNNTVGRPSGVAIRQHVEEETDAPYVRVGEKIETPAKPFGRAGFSELVRIHVFSVQQGDQECLTVSAWVATSLEGAVVTAQGFGNVVLRVASTTVSQDPDGTYHGIVAVRARPIAS